MKLALICAMHGNEPYGISVAKQCILDYFIGNPLALKKQVRFIEEDLNRCFPGKENGSIEEKAAFFLLNKLSSYDAVIDLHSTSNDCPLFGIITELSEINVELAKKLNLDSVVYFPKNKRKGTALIDVFDGISLEAGPHDSSSMIKDVADKINSFGEESSSELCIYEVIAVIPQRAEQILIKNFQIVKKGDVIAKGKTDQLAEFDFTAVLVNEKSYVGVLCIAVIRKKYKRELKKKKNKLKFV